MEWLQVGWGVMGLPCAEDMEVDRLRRGQRGAS